MRGNCARTSVKPMTESDSMAATGSRPAARSSGPAIPRPRRPGQAACSALNKSAACMSPEGSPALNQIRGGVDTRSHLAQSLGVVARTKLPAKRERLFDRSAAAIDHVRLILLLVEGAALLHTNSARGECF